MADVLLDALQVAGVLGILSVVLGGGTLAMATWMASKRPKDQLADRINALLPQTQCAQCGYPGCRPYAAAIVAGERLDLCPPGGNATARALATLLDRPFIAPSKSMPVNTVAYIDEQQCVGCARCIKACPVDAIVGAEQFAHTVIVDHCTGCERCLPVCPVDCIDINRRIPHA